MKPREKIKSENLKSELAPEQSVELLKELHLLTSNGDLNADARRKLKQVNHLIQLIKPAWDDLSARHSEINIVDLGAGKSYLGFILYDAFVKKAASPGASVFAVESRADLVEKSREISQRLKFEKMHFIQGQIGESAGLPERVHLLTALHACDTATDDAIIMGLQTKADFMAIVPCCQAEVARLLEGEGKASVSELWRHGIHRREFGSHLTNVLRCLVLESQGYRVSVTELVGWEHSMKNEFIFAKRVNQENKNARAQLDELLAQISVRPKLVRHLLD